MPRHLLMIGGGHAHLSLLEAAPNLVADGHRITLVSLEPVHYYSGMGPGMLGGAYDPAEIRFPIREIAQDAGVHWVRDRAVRIRPVDHVVELASGREVAYDVLSVNTGSTVAPTVAVDSEVENGGPRVYTVKPIEQMRELRRYVEALTGAKAREEVAPHRFTVVGGGPAAVEAAANLTALLRSVGPETGAESEVELIVGRTVLPGFPRRAERLTTRALRQVGVKLRLNEHVRRVTSEGIVTRQGIERTDVVLLATGVVPSRLFADSQLPVGTDGSLAVNRQLHCLGHEDIFGAGDCIWYTPQPLPRAGVFAVRESPVLVHNVRAALEGRFSPLRSFSPGGGYLLLLNFGDGTALFWRRILGVHVVYRGRSAWRLKNRIDFAFMHRFGSEADRGNEH